MKTIFEFDDYKDYLRSLEETRSAVQRGFRSRLAEELGCKSAYISNVLNNDAHFSLEQAFKVAKFLGIDEQERKYLLALVEYARAGTKELRDYFAHEIRELRERSLNLKDRVAQSTVLSPEAQALYYSHWMYAAIHMLTTIKSYRDPLAIVGALNLPEEAVRSAIVFLLSAGLVQERSGKLVPGVVQIHLPKNSNHIRQHHTNWRLAAIDSLVQIEKNDIHYSTVSTLSRADAEKIKAHFVKEIESYTQRIQPSPEETLYGFNLDFYTVLKK